MVFMLGTKRYHPSKYVLTKKNINYKLQSDIPDSTEQSPDTVMTKVTQNTTVEDLEGGGFMVKGGKMKSQPKNEKLRKFVNLQIK